VDPELIHDVGAVKRGVEERVHEESEREIEDAAY
jgi:hypothetical protein